MSEDDGDSGGDVRMLKIVVRVQKQDEGKYL